MAFSRMGSNHVFDYGRTFVLMTIERVKHPTILAAIHAVMSEVSYVQKKTRVQSYTAAGESEIISAVRPSMLKNGIIGPIPVDGTDPAVQVQDKSWTDSSGKVSPKQMRYIVVRRTFRFAHVDSKDVIDVVTYGEGSDNLDKAALKAMTAARKYAIRETFCLETGDDPDYTPSEEEAKSTSWFATAVAKVNECATEKACDTLEAKFDNTEAFDHDQREQLRRLLKARRVHVRGG